MSTAAGQPNGDPVVRLVGVHKRFGELIVLDGIDLDLQPGRTTVIIGESPMRNSVCWRRRLPSTTHDTGFKDSP